MKLDEILEIFNKIIKSAGNFLYVILLLLMCWFMIAFITLVNKSEITVKEHCLSNTEIAEPFQLHAEIKEPLNKE